MVGMLGRFPHGLVAFMLVGSVPFGLLPSPMQGQYLIAVFALLIVLGVCSLSDGTARSLARLTVPGLIILVGVGVGALRTAPRLLRFVHPAAWSTTLLHEEALAMKAMLPAGSPCVATLSPIRALEAGARIYTELASGPFFFRSGDLLRPEQVKTLRGASPSTLAQILDEKPPAAVLVGYEGDDDWHIDLDGILVAYAASRNYREISVPAGDSRLFLNPHVSASCS